MIDRDSPVTEDELHAYVDGELPADRTGGRGWLASSPGDAARVAAWRAQAEAIRARYGAAVDEPVPTTRARRAQAGSGATDAPGRIAAAAAVVAFVVGGAAGWMARGASAAAPSTVDLFTSDALDAHKLYIGRGAPSRSRCQAASEAHLLPWLSRRVGTTSARARSRAIGLKLWAARLLPGSDRRGRCSCTRARSGERFTIYCSQGSTRRETAFRYDGSDSFGAVLLGRRQDTPGWSAGPNDRERLEKVTKAAYEQVEKTGAKKL